MFKNYLKTAFRNLQKTKMFSLINICGLAIGMAAFLLILHYVHFEKSYDKFHENSERIYRLRYERTDSKGDAVRFASCCPPAAARICGKYPKVEKIGRMLHYSAIVSFDNIKFREERMYFTEPEVFEVLKFKFSKGDPLTGLKEPNKTFISYATAKKYFGDLNPIGKTISVDKKNDYQVVGIFDDIPQNSHLKFDILLPWKNLESIFDSFKETLLQRADVAKISHVTEVPGRQIYWDNGGIMKAGEDINQGKNYQIVGIDYDFADLFDYFFLDDYYNQQYQNDQQFGRVFSLFAALASIITVLGILGLSSFSATQRIKEIGIRKVIGASVSKILLLLSRDFLILIVVAFTISLLPTIFGINKWLESFANRMNLSGWLFVVPLAVVFIITILTIGSHAIKAALANPVESLRYE